MLVMKCKFLFFNPCPRNTLGGSQELPNPSSSTSVGTLLKLGYLNFYSAESWWKEPLGIKSPQPSEDISKVRYSKKDRINSHSVLI